MMSIDKLLGRIKYFLAQPDLSQHPVQGIMRRIQWRIYWMFHKTPMILRDWYHGLTIALPHSGSAAQVFYRKHSNFEIVRVMEETLQDGDTAIDIGAHIGEYTLIAAHLVGPEGQVHAVEPQPHAAEMIAMNGHLNQFDNVHIHKVAVGRVPGHIQFFYDQRTWGGLILLEGVNLTVRCITLDELAEEERLSYVRLIKIDAAGNEKDVLLGGQNLLKGEQPPVIICKFYNPQVVKERFGYEAREIVKILHEWGYQIVALTSNGEVPITVDNCYGLFRNNEYGLPLKAWRSKC